ncbi:MAG: hypothetical protein RIK87_27790 [Fuerstiella sp.]
MKILVVVVTVVVMLAVIIASTGLHSWEYQKSVDGIRYSRVRSEDHPSHGRITIGRLADPVEIDGRIYRDWLHRREDGTIVGGLLAEDTIAGDLNIPAGTWVSFTADNDLRACHFPKDQDIQGYRCRGTGGGGKGAVVSFYPSGRLKFFFSGTDITIRNIPCRGGLFSGIGLHEDGQLQTCTLAKSVTIYGRDLERGTRVHFTEDGVLTTPAGGAQ